MGRVLDTVPESQVFNDTQRQTMENTKERQIYTSLQCYRDDLGRIWILPIELCGGINQVFWSDVPDITADSREQSKAESVYLQRIPFDFALLSSGAIRFSPIDGQIASILD